MNVNIFYFFYNLGHQSRIFDKIVTFFAVYFPVLILLFICIYIFYKSSIYKKNNFSWPVLKKLIQDGISIIGPAFTAYILATILKEIIHTDRSFVQFNGILPLFNPNQEYSFPSTHAAIFSALAFTVFFLNKKAGYAFMFFALLIGIARIIAGVHFPIDILGGFILGALIALLFKKFIIRLNTF